MAQLSVTEEIARYGNAGPGTDADGTDRATARRLSRSTKRKPGAADSRGAIPRTSRLPVGCYPASCCRTFTRFILLPLCRRPGRRAGRRRAKPGRARLVGVGAGSLLRRRSATSGFCRALARRSTNSRSRDEPFARLLTAFRQDQRVARYRTHDDVLGYCRNSADPVGRLILYLGRSHDARRGELSDSICTGLQLVNFCQDVARDWRRGRIYLPLETLQRLGCRRLISIAHLVRATSAKVRPTPCGAVSVEVDRAESYLRGGMELVELVPRELRVEVSLFLAGGLSVVDAIRRQGYDVWRRRPTVSYCEKTAAARGLLVECSQVSAQGAPR